MSIIHHRVGIAASSERVYDALSSLDGLSRWWAAHTTGSTRLGGIIHLPRDAGGYAMQVSDFQAGLLVHWKCVDGPREWIGTDVTFRLQPEREQTFVQFTHGGWADGVEAIGHASTKWATFLLSLKHWLERSEGRPFPYDMKVFVGD
jgi:uncharacterized protein YndB with AHSA1/START domain